MMIELISTIAVLQRLAQSDRSAGPHRGRQQQEQDAAPAWTRSPARQVRRMDQLGSVSGNQTAIAVKRPSSDARMASRPPADGRPGG
jgi:hypothetical protein